MFLTIDDRKSLRTVFLIAICRQSGDKRQSKSLFLTIFDLRSSIVSTFSIAAYPLWIVLANTANPDEMPHSAAFHVGLHCLQKYLFSGFQSTKV